MSCEQGVVEHVYKHSSEAKARVGVLGQLGLHSKTLSQRNEVK